jgi:hypothetical protein
MNTCGMNEHLRSLLRVLAGALPPAAPGASLRLELPTTSISVPPADADDALLWDGLLALGLSDALDLWHALLFERSVLLLSDHSALLTAACDVLLLLREPLRWEGTYVPYLPPSLLDAVEAPTPFLMGCGRTAFLAAATRLDAGPIFVADLDAGRLTRPGAVAGMGPPPPLPKDAASFLEPLAPPRFQIRATLAERLHAHRSALLWWAAVAPAAPVGSARRARRPSRASTARLIALSS